jgi:hypothetical protein
MQTGANISQLFLSASGFLHLLFLPMELLFEIALNHPGATPQRRIDENFCFE